MDISPPTFTSDRLFAGDSQAESILRGIDWSQRRLGPVSRWPVTLRTALRICLTSRHAMIIWWGDELTFFYNDAYAPTLSTRHPGAMGRPGQQVWPEIWEVIGPMLRGVMTTGTATWSDDQMLFLERNGYPEETYHSFSYSPIEGEDGTVEGVFTAVTETTQRVLAERRAALARDLAGSLVDTHTTTEVAQQAVTILSTVLYDIPASLIYRVEPDSVTLTCLASAHVDASAVMILDRADAATHRALSGVLASQEALVMPWGAIPFLGEAEWSPQRALVLPINEPGQALPTLLWVAGISPHRELDTDYRALFAQLQGHLATALVAAHAYEAERQRAEALATIDRAKTVFFSNVSHEFRTPLALLMGPITDSLEDRDEPLPPGQQARLVMAQRNGQRLLKLVNTLLDFSRIEAGRVQATYVPTNLAELTTDLASTFRSLIETAGMHLVIDCPPLPEPVYVDQDMWEKVVLNLLSNAFKFTLAGSISVQLRAVGRQAVLVVQDTGTGIPTEELPRLFERFHRVEGARARTQEGSGIGLALVHELVQLHGGTITAASIVGVGTTFTLTLPFGTAHLPPERLGKNSSLASTALSAETFLAEAERWLPAVAHASLTPVLPESPLSREDPLAVTGGRLVLADDNADMRDYLTRLLGAHYQVRAVANGALALAVIRDDPPDLVLSDVMMPDLDGFGLVQALRNDKHTAAIPVILLSARAGEEATVEGLNAGADDYLVKPFSARELLARVAAHLALARLRREVQRGAAELEAVFEAVTDGLAVYDQKGHILRANAALRGFLARFHDEQIPPTLHERVRRIPMRDDHGVALTEDMWPQSRILRGESLTGETAMEVEVQGDAGEPLALSVTGAPLLDAAGAIIGAVVANRDVTERRRQERVVRERARQLQAIFAAVADGIVIYDTQGNLVEWNAALAELFEFARIPDYSGMVVSERPARLRVRDVQGQPVPAADLPFMRAAQGEILTGPNAVDLVITLPSERLLNVSVSASPLRDALGDIVGAVAVYRDVTERRRLEQRVHQSLEALLALTENLVGISQADDARGDDPLRAIGVRLVALMQRVFACDMASMSVLDPQTGSLQPLGVIGLDPDAEARWWRDVPRTPLHDYVAADTLSRIYAGEAVELDVDIKPFLNGADYGIHRILMAPMLLGEMIVGLMAVEQRNAQHPYTANDRALMTAMGRVSALAIERNRLLREQTAAATREAALTESNRRMDEFLGIASHELRTPLTSIMANVQLSERGLRNLFMQEGESQSPQVERYQHLLTQSNRQLARLNRLIGDLLDVSRITAGKLEMRIARHDLVAIVREVVAAQQIAWPHREVQLSVPTRLPVEVMADPDRIEQVVVNLITNALKYSPREKPVHIRVQRERSHVRVSVHDQGAGLTAEQTARLFTRFTRVDEIAQQDGSGVGLGLGLYICKTIIDRHDGTIGVESQAGQGSTFFFTLPRA